MKRKATSDPDISLEPNDPLIAEEENSAPEVNTADTTVVEEEVKEAHPFWDLLEVAGYHIW